MIRDERLPSDEHRLSATVRRMPVRTPTLPPATHTNTYVVGSEEAVLIEPASPYEDELDKTLRWVQQLVSEGLRFRAILITHHHRDHVGGALSLRERLGLPLWAHPRTAERLAPGIDVDATLEDDEGIELAGPEPTRLRAVFTPGHAPGHLCFVDEHSRMMIAGDMVASVGTIIVEPRDGNMIEYLASLRRMKALAPAALLPAHGGPIHEVDEKLDFYVAHRLMRESKVLQALAARAKPARARDLVPVAYADAPRQAWPLAAQSTEAHLIKLEAEGRAERTKEGWRAC